MENRKGRIGGRSQPALQRFSSGARRTIESDVECGREQRDSTTTANVDENRHAKAGMDWPSAVSSIGNPCLNDEETVKCRLIEQMDIDVLCKPLFIR